MAEFDTTKHFLVPKHEVISEEEREKIFKSLNITERQLPKILVTDPVIKAIGAEEGNIIKITRNSVTAGTSVYYRLVSKAVR